MARPRFYRTPSVRDAENPHPLYVVWEITLACDLGCRHCGSRAGQARSEELDTAGCLDVVAQLADLGVREVTLIGGEAYLREDWDVIAKAITDRGMGCGITTGGRGLDAARVARAVDAGVQTISVSIDGLEHTHDDLRGPKGAWRSAVDAAERIAKAGLRLATNSQINRLSLPELPALTSLLVDLGVSAWQTQLTVPMGRAADRPQLLLQPWELGGLFPLLVHLKETRLEPGGVTLFPGNNLGYYGPFESKLRFGGDRGAHWQGCPAGQWSIGLEADGKIKACPSLPSSGYTGGNVRDLSIADAVDNTREIAFIRDRTRASLWGFCRTCYYGDVCRAGCTLTSQVLLGRPGNNPYCIHRVMTLEEEGRRERLEKVSDAPGAPFDQGRFQLVEEPADPEPQATLAGWPVDEALALPWGAGSIWTAAQRAEILRPRAARLPVLVS